MTDRQDEWFADEEGNLTGPGDPNHPTTDEFGRTDPAAIEREQRRLEREQKRKSKRKRTHDLESEPPPPEVHPSVEEVSPRRSAGERAAAGREALRRRFSRGDRGGDAPAGGDAPGGGEGTGGDDRPPRSANYRRRRFIALAAGLVGILLLWFLVALFQPFKGDGEGRGSVTVEIPEGSSASEIASVLEENDVVASARLFEWRLKLAGKSDDVQADTYTLAEDMSYGTAIDRLTGEQAMGDLTVTIPEGLDRNQVAADVLPEGVSSDEYLGLTETAPKGFDPSQYGAKGQGLEGFLFPATYDLSTVPEGQSTSKALVEQQLQALEDNIAKVDMSYARKKNLTPYDVLIIASMIDKEVQVPKERKLVASVIYNRLKQGIPLGIDATTRYETQNYTEPIPQSAFEENTPYNTRLNAGLTPTPIGNPGLDAIRAAARPADTKFIFFVVKPGTCGEHSFTASEAEFEKLAAEYQQALEEQGGSPTEC